MSAGTLTQQTSTPRQTNASGSMRQWCPAYEIHLASRASSLMFLLILAVPASLLMLVTFRVVAAQTWGDSLNPETVRKAIALDPGNPQLHFALGRLLLLNAGPETLTTAERELRLATTMNPYAAEFWSGLGKACYASVNQPCADAAFRRAQQLAPNKPQFAWDAAVNYVVSNQPNAAVEQLKHFLRLQPNGLTQTFDLLMRGFDDPNLVWRDLLGDAASPLAKIRFLEYLAEHNNFETAEGFWAQLSATGVAVPVTDTTNYVDELLAAGHPQAAARVWTYAVRKGQSTGITADGHADIVFNLWL